MTIIAKLRNSLARRIDNAMLEYNTFQERFAESPADAMIWSDSLFNAAARIDIYKGIIKRLDNEEDLEEIIDAVERAINTAIRSQTCFSTSQTSNLYDVHKLKVLSDARETLVDWLEEME